MKMEVRIKIEMEIRKEVQENVVLIVILSGVFGNLINCQSCIDPGVQIETANGTIYKVLC